MDLRQLEIFSAVMRCGTTVAAAKDLSLSQSVVSTAIKQAEAELGFLLFERISNRLVPTAEARILLEEAEPLFVHKEAVNQRARDLKAGRLGRVRIAATAELSESLLPGVMVRFLRRHPSVHLTLDTRPLSSVLDSVETGMADIGFGMEAHDRRALSLAHVSHLTLVCVCQKDSVLARLPEITPAALRDRDLIAPQMSNGIGVLLAEAFAKAAVPYSPLVEVRFLNVAARLVREGWGCAILDELTVSTGSYDDLVVRPFRPAISLSLSTILPRERISSRLTTQFAEDFAAVARDHLDARGGAGARAR